MTSGHDEAADELRLLALGLLDRVEPGLRTVAAVLRERAEQVPTGAHPATCTWCPLCAVVGALRGERPELVATVVEHADGLLNALRAALVPAAAAASPATGGDAATAGDAASSAGAAATAGSADAAATATVATSAAGGERGTPRRVQRIDVRPAGETDGGC